MQIVSKSQPGEFLAPSGLILASGKTGLLIIAADCDDHKLCLSNRLPQKQGLCQVVNAADFGTLSDF